MKVNELGDTVAAGLPESLQTNQCIQMLHLHHTAISSQGARSLLGTLRGRAGIDLEVEPVKVPKSSAPPRSMKSNVSPLFRVASAWKGGSSSE
ncbi:hypothetical protein M427DRAFT_419352 [Gonapodya prolifera JEL478]|uniref:Uncharacterized protein n=1 Tax=Gonapodya prolifera (strain JEL478) TaxID=1344416 RepID=A0A139A554_GONPJ|nr:hypothetical protein M427DRAFT_419352 [Gonapodya prolifera JEL478]|eukprot:KXS11768.1 hypothetical protein M427DRAFT_419352 [Gonapodya prolifera JEL478]